LITTHRLIKHTAQDLDGIHHLATYLEKHALTASLILFAFISIFGFLNIHVSQASELTIKTSTENSQTLSLLAPNFTIVVPDAIGGPIYINERNDILLANIGALAGDEAITIENTNGVSLYIVRQGDTLSEVAELFDVSINTIKWENNIKGNTLRVGQELRILPLTGISHTIAKGESFGKIAQMYDVEVEDITIFNNLDPKSLKVGQKIIVPNGVKKEVVVTKKTKKSGPTSFFAGLKEVYAPSSKSGTYIRPISGRISSPFGPRSLGYHYGIDFAVPVGTPVVASASGTVVRTSCGSGYGTCLIIQHDDTQTLYAHNSALLVSAGTQVKQGQMIAYSGNTGRSTGPHLHFEIIKSNGQKLNPNNIL